MKQKLTIDQVAPYIMLGALTLFAVIFFSYANMYYDNLRKKEREMEDTRKLKVTYGEVYLVKTKFYGVGECTAKRYQYGAVTGDCMFSSGAIIKDFDAREEDIIRKVKNK